jgi:hypothetical protein
LTGGLVSGIKLSTIFSTSLSCDSFDFSAFEAISSNDLMRMVGHRVSSEKNNSPYRLLLLREP